MSGMACAAFSAKAGAKVLVVEKQPTVGGSSSYSAGMLYGFELFSVDNEYGIIGGYCANGALAGVPGITRVYDRGCQQATRSSRPRG